jgi:hypothetical protein
MGVHSPPPTGDTTSESKSASPARDQPLLQKHPAWRLSWMPLLSIIIRAPDSWCSDSGESALAHDKSFQREI